MDLRGGDPESTRSACVKLRDLAVAAEGPGAPFTATRRGQQLLRLIHIVVQNVGLEDKVGALTALRLLKADDTLLQRLLKEGILPPLLAIIARDAADADGDWDGSVVADAGAARLRLVRAETAAAAARAVEAFSSSGDSLTTLLRGGGVRRGAGAYFREQPRVGSRGSRPVREPFRWIPDGSRLVLRRCERDAVLARVRARDVDGAVAPLFAGIGRRRGAPRRRRGFGETRLFRARGPNRHRAVRRRAPADDRRARRERRAESRRARRARRHLFSRRARRVREPFPFG